MNERTIRFGILHKILFTMLLVSLIPLAVTWLVNYRTSVDQLTRQTDHELRALTAHLADSIDGWVEMNQRMLRQNASLADIRSMQPERQNPVLEQIAREYDWGYLAFTTDLSGNNIGRSDGKAPKYYGDRVYVKQVLEGAPLGQQVLIGKTSGQPALVLASPIHQPGGELSGVLAIAMTIAEISADVVDTRVGQTGSAFLLDPEGKVIAHPSTAFTQQRRDLSAHPAFRGAQETAPDRVTYVDSLGKRFIAHSKRTEQGWILIAEQPYDEAYAAVADTNRNALILAGGTIALVIFIAALVASRLSAPIRNLTRIADEFSRGQLDTEIAETARKDKIGALARAIERLGVSVRYAMERLQHKAAA